MNRLPLLLPVLLLLVLFAGCNNDEPEQPEGTFSVNIDGVLFEATSLTATMTINTAASAKNFVLTASDGTTTIELNLLEVPADITDACFPNTTFTLNGGNRTCTIGYTVNGQTQGLATACTVNTTDCSTNFRRLDGNFTATLITGNGEVSFTNGRFVDVLYEVR